MRLGIRLATRRSRRAAAAAGLSLLTLAGCASSGGMAGTGTVNTTVTIGEVPGIGTVPLYLARKDGLFTSAGLTVQLRQFSSATAETRALASGQIDIAAGDYGPFLYAAAAGSQTKPQIRLIGDGYDAATGVLEILSLPGSGITSPQDLQGQKIATPDSAGLNTAAGTPDSLEAAAATSVMRAYGVDMATITWKPMAASQELQALRDHAVHAILVTEPYIYQAQSKLGAAEVLDACSGGTSGLPLSGYFTTTGWAGSRPTALTDFRAAMAKAQVDAAQSGSIQNALPGFAGMTRQEAAVVTLGTYPTSVNASDVQRVSQLLSNQGVLRTPVTIARLLIR